MKNSNQTIKVLSIYETATVIKYWQNLGFTIVFMMVPLKQTVVKLPAKVA